MAAAGGVTSSSKLHALLKTLDQGDLLTLGAVAIVGRGTTEVLEAAGGKSKAKELWSVTVESELGWYVIVSGVCDVVRDPAIEPCIVVAPISTVSAIRYQQLRSGEYSPREFPLSATELVKVVQPADPDSFWPVVDLRYVTSIDKAALLHDEVDSRRPLTSPQRQRFSTWVGRRFNRPANSDELETHVLTKAGEKISKLAGQFAQATAPGSLPPEVRLVGAAREWLIGGSERAIDVYVVIDAHSAAEAGLYDNKAGEISESLVAGAVKKLRDTFVKTLVSGSGYTIKVLPVTLDGISAAHYLSLNPWLWADKDDPLDP
jgi:hypothetical protein